MSNNREQLTQQIIDTGRFLYDRDRSPATSSSYSARLDEQRALLIVLGKYKGQLDFDGMLAAGLVDNGLELGKEPSAGTLLHTQPYIWNPMVGAVLHTYSVNATMLPRLVRGDRLILQDYELQKTFAGVAIHEGQVEMPIFDSGQGIARLASRVQPWLEAHPHCPGYLIRSHGLYTQDARVSDALRQVGAFEFLSEYELEALSLSR